MTITLHLGAHRTGSTRLQLALDRNAAVLAERGIVALTPPRPGKRGGTTIRDIVTRALRGGPKEQFQEGLRKLSGDPPPGRLVISDEEILGPAFGRHGRGFYPQAAERLRQLSDLLPQAPSGVCMMIRSYETFLVSFYAMRALHTKGMRPFDQIKGRVLDVGGGWPALVDDVSRIFPEADLHLMTLEETPLADQMVAFVGEGVAIDLSSVEAMQVNAAPSADAIDAALSGADGTPDEIITRFADGRRFDPLSTEEKEALSKRYQDDLDALGLSQSVPSRA